MTGEIPLWTLRTPRRFRYGPGLAVLAVGVGALVISWQVPAEAPELLPLGAFGTVGGGFLLLRSPWLAVTAYPDRLVVGNLRRTVTVHRDEIVDIDVNVDVPVRGGNACYVWLVVHGGRRIRLDATGAGAWEPDVDTAGAAADRIWDWLEDPGRTEVG